jgi:hypothetical protein
MISSEPRQIETYLDLVDLASEVEEREGCYYDVRFEIEKDLNIELQDDIDSQRFDARIQRSPLNTWICTDTEVGLFAYYLDGRLVGFSYLGFRKGLIQFKWINRESAQDVRRAIFEMGNTFDASTIDDSPIDPEWTRKRVFYGYWD